MYYHFPCTIYMVNDLPFIIIITLMSQAKVGDDIVGAIVCKLDEHKKGSYRGYIAMLAVDKEHRRKKIGIIPEFYSILKLLTGHI